MWSRRKTARQGQTVVEYLLSFFLLLIVFYGIVQLVILLTSYNVLQYASFMAARAYQVYGKKTLQEIGYPAAGQAGRYLTAPAQTAAEAAAERILADSLLWEGWRVKGPHAIEDGIDDGAAAASGVMGSGAFRIRFLDGRGATVSYCLPTVYQSFPVTSFGPNTCEDTRHNLKGILIGVKTELGQEPEVSP